jgi:hypothetical protein
MNKTEVGKLLTIASGFDRRQVDMMTIEAWHAVPVVAGADFEVAQQVLIDHQTSPQAAEYFTVRHLAAGIKRVARSNQGDVEADVRSAKARGLIGAEHPPRQPLPADVAAQLAAARQRDREVAVRFEIGTGGGDDAA